MTLNHRLSILALLVIVAFGLPSQHASAQVEAVLAKGAAVATKYAISYLGSKLLDGVWDQSTGRPDIKLIASRLEELENNAALRSEMQSAIRALRHDLDQNVSRQEMEERIAGLQAELVGIHRRIVELEIENQLQDVRIEDLETGTTNCKNPEYFVNRGNACLERNDPTTAMANFAAALRVDERCTDAYLSRAIFHLESGAVEVAQMDYESVLTFDGSNRTAQLGRATTRFILREYEDAITDATLVLAQEPSLFDALFIRGNSHFINGDAQLALADFEAAVKVNSRSAFAHNGCGVSFHKLGNLDAAIREFDRAIEIKPIPFFYANRGSAHKDLGNTHEALNDINTSLGHIAMKPFAEDTSSELGRIVSAYYLRRRESLVSCAELPFCYEVRGFLHAELGNEDQAVADLTRAVNLGSQSGDVYAVRGAQMVLIGSPRQGLADLNVGMTQGLSRVSEYYLYSSRAIAFYDLGRFEESAYSAKKALSSPGAERRKHNAYMDWIAFNANERCGKYDAAYASLLAAIEKNPEQAKEIECGFVQVINKTKTAVRFCPDYWIDYDGNKVDINNYRFFNGLQAFWTLQPGDSVVINYDGKPFRASTISAWLEDTESSKHGGTWTWTSSGGSLHTTIELLDKMLP